MFSFMKIATFATVAFGALAAALPQPIASPEVNDLAVRDAAATSTVTSILQQLNTDLQPHVAQLNGYAPSDCTPANIEPIIIAIKIKIQAAIDACHGKPHGSGDLLVLVSVVINLVLGVCGKIYGYGGVDKVALKVIFQLLDGVIAALLQLVLGLLGGILSLLIGLLVGLLGGCISIILELDLHVCIGVLLL